jgi:hypothetical protein
MDGNVLIIQTIQEVERHLAASTALITLKDHSYFPFSFSHRYSSLS